jgi:unsaturated chondroitin disaccharide hydrolase
MGLEIQQIMDRLISRVETTAKSDLPGFPHYSDDYGRWICTRDGDWTGGFWVGMLWLSYLETGEEKFFDWAKKWMRHLRNRIESETVFRCFLFYYGAALGDILFDDREAREMAINGARGLAKLYNKNAGIIPLGRAAEEAGSVGLDQTNIDGCMAIALLSYAAEKTGENILREIGVRHALSHIKLCVNEDGSVIQSASFDPNTGSLIKRYTHKGYNDDTVWSRAQAWAMLGYTLALKWAPEVREFYQTALLVSDFWVKHLPSDSIAFWDFNDPYIPHTSKDTSATAIAASSLIKLSQIVNDEAVRQRYYRKSVESVESLSKLVTPTNPNDSRPIGMLTQGCYNKRIALATNNELIWGNYYLLESLLMLKSKLTQVI